MYKKATGSFGSARKLGEAWSQGMTREEQMNGDRQFDGGSDMVSAWVCMSARWEGEGLTKKQ